MRLSLATLVSVFFLTACDSTQSLRELRQAVPVNDPYRVALAEQYRDLSEEKLASYDWWTSKYFADKGLMTAYGRDVAPEDPALWGLATPEFIEARDKLMAALEPGMARDPEMAATTVIDYDRWVELQNHGWDIAAIEGAKAMFMATLEELTTPLKPETAAATGKSKRAEELLASVAETTSAILYFPFDADQLTKSARAALNEMLKYIRSAGPATISINGHADRVGSDQYNTALSQRRARFVMEMLRKAGVPDAQMEYFAFGETDLKVPTADNVAEPHNRRVEIFLE